jgi:hypothetical protein
VGLFWTIHQLSSASVARWLWQPARALNDAMERYVGGDLQTIGWTFMGYRIQEMVLIAAVGGVVLSLCRRGQRGGPPAFSVLVAILTPWLTNSEALIIGAATASSALELAWILAGAGLGIVGAAGTFAALYFRNRRLAGALGLATVFFSMGFVYWLNSPVTPVLAYGSVIVAWCLLVVVVLLTMEEGRADLLDGAGTP